MVDKEILSYIKKGVKRGFPINELKQSLLAKGHADFDVDEAIKEYKSNSGGGKNLDSPGKSLSFFSPKFVLYSIFGILAAFVVVFFAIWTGQSDGATIYLNEGLDQGLSVDLMQNKIEFDVGGENETIEFSSSKASVDLDYGGGEESLIVGEKKNIDLDDDGVYDLEIRLDAIVEGVPKIYFKKIQLKVGEEKVFTPDVEVVKEIPESYVVNFTDDISCEEKWVCTEWPTCVSNGFQERECKDLNNCGKESGEPDMRRTCYYEGNVDENASEEEFCEENWVCGTWNDCTTTGVQERGCEDLNECGTDELVPERQRTCNYQEPVDPLPPEEVPIEVRKEICLDHNAIHLEEGVNCEGEIVSYNTNSGIAVTCCLPPTDVVCAGQDEDFSLDGDYNPNACCEGLDNVHTTDSISVADKCYWVGTESGYPGGICSDCGNGVCEEVESVCGCSEDCVGKERSDYHSVEAFCEDGFGQYCSTDLASIELDLCQLCTVNTASN